MIHFLYLTPKTRLDLRQARLSNSNGPGISQWKGGKILHTLDEGSRRNLIHQSTELSFFSYRTFARGQAIMGCIKSAVW